MKRMVEPLTEKELWSKAIQYLARREYTRKELVDKLAKLSPDNIEAVLDSLESEGYQSDRRFTESFVRMRAAQGHGLNRIRFDLQKKGVSSNLLNEVLEELCVDWYEQAAEVYSRKYASVLKDSDYKEKSKRMRFMSQRGYSMDEIMHAISEHHSEID